jgi:VIT1/CCC1 family predicted Fe2+/Mn2+ transporter
MRSKFLTLNVRDFLKGLLLAVLTAVITFMYDAIQSGTLFEPGWVKKAGMVALAALLAYLIKNLFTNTQGEILTPENK